MASWREQRTSQADANRELARQRETERLQNEAIAKARPGYAKYNAGWEGLNDEQKLARYEQWQNEALQLSDNETATRIGTIISAIRAKMPVPKPLEYTYRDDGTGRIFQFDPAGKNTGIFGERRPVRGGGDSEDGGVKMPVAGALGRVDKKATELQKSVESMEAQKRRLAAAPENGMEQVAVLYDFIKSRDGSTVRDGERVLITKVNSLLGRFGLSVDSLRSGQILTRTQVAQMMAIIESEIEAKRRAYSKASMVDRAVLKSAGLDVTPFDQIFTSPSTTVPAPAPAQGGASPGSYQFTPPPSRKKIP